jgi:hypothetical protein
VKNLLVGLPPTDIEVQTVTENPDELETLVSGWMSLPEYNAKMLAFFRTQFQQDGWSYGDLVFQYVSLVPFSLNEEQIVRNFQESFARTALELIAEGQPFTSVFTTTRFMMTPALMAAYATMDDVHIDDNYDGMDLFHTTTPVSVTVESSTSIPISDAIDPANPSFMTFYNPSIASPYQTGCPYGTIVYPAPVTAPVVGAVLFNGTIWNSPGSACFPPPVHSSPYITDSDFTNWQMIHVRTPQPGEKTTQLFDLPSMRAGNDLVLNVPRVGFFTTPAFNARWPTNDSNLARVLLNQSLIVTLGEPIDTTNVTQPLSEAALDGTHAAPGTPCYSCHQSLDPMRQYFRHDYTLYGSIQEDPTQRAMPGQFAFHGVVGTGSSIADFAARLASHPLLATAWVQKLCTWATSLPCDETDPEFQRIVGVFQSSHFSWNALVQALFASPLVTNLQPTQTATSSGTVSPIARQEHLCATLSNRLGSPDLCGLNATTQVVSPTVQAVAASWPSDQYSRGAATASQVTVPTLMMRGGMESLCTSLAQLFVDNGTTSAFQSSDPPAAIHNLATILMGLTSDRVAAPQAILTRHFQQAQVLGASASDALKSTFVLACLSPYVVSIGQ